LGRGDGDLGAKQPLRDIDDPPGGHTLHVHLGQRQVQGLLGARAALQRTRVEASAAHLGYIEGHFADSGPYRPGLEAVGVVAPCGVAFVGLGAKILGPLYLGNLVNENAQRLENARRLAGAVQAVGQQRFAGRRQGVFFDFLRHGHVPFKKIGSSCPATAAPLPSVLRRTKSQKGCCTNRRPHSDRQTRHIGVRRRARRSRVSATGTVTRAYNILATIGNTPHIRANRLFGASHQA
jgi:hypothetical protein